MDITERKQAEEELERYRNHLEEMIEQRTKELAEAQKASEAANKAKSDFLANMSHEIRTPMNALLGYSELLAPLVSDPIQKEYVHSMQSSGNSLLTLINDILDLSKIEAGKRESQYEYVDTESLFKEMENIFSLKCTDKGIEFLFEVSSGLPPGIYIDETAVRQMLLNLLGNAIKFTDKGYVKLSAYPENQRYKKHKDQSEEIFDLIIEVEDTGMGISKDQQNKIFDVFRQIDPVNTKKTGGTGLGLAITKKLIEMMNGSISINSKLNKGTTFHVTLPEVSFLQELHRVDREIQVNPEEVIFEEGTVLVVDDVESNRKVFTDALRNTSLDVHEAGNGEEAYNLAKKIKPDLIITDIKMPDMDGFELLEKIKSHNKLKDIPVLAYTAEAIKSQMERIMKSEFAGVMIKPTKINKLYLELMNLMPHKVIEMETEEVKESIHDIPDEHLTPLINELEGDLYSTWKKFKNRQPLNEVKEFGKDIVALGEKYQAKRLEKYGKELVDAAGQFNVSNILLLLKKYPEKIEELKKLRDGKK